jgi:hypothetical protein
MQEKARMEIPILDLSAQHRQLGREIDEAIARVLQNQKFILGPKFERSSRNWPRIVSA